MRKWLLIILPISLLVFQLLTAQHYVLTDGGFDRVFGFPLVYTTSNIGFTHHYEVYVLPMLFDASFYFIIIAIIAAITFKAGITIKNNKLLTGLGVLMILLTIGVFYFQYFESSFYVLNNTPYKVQTTTISIGNLLQ
jgi:hypothetical protein